ncbi:hypothetical protein COO60DRAFT_399009 [Scenedesmus sp. NREL 46B-D3]|nr:hypothetical protein COO60DRAFT_399009 [Scenedesmus sp. NREL 46B-D3]
MLKMCDTTRDHNKSTCAAFYCIQGCIPDCVHRTSAVLTHTVTGEMGSMLGVLGFPFFICGRQTDYCIYSSEEVPRPCVPGQSSNCNVQRFSHAHLNQKHHSRWCHFPELPNYQSRATGPPAKEPNKAHGVHKTQKKTINQKKPQPQQAQRAQNSENQ